jgi:hypothetical protein
MTTMLRSTTVSELVALQERCAELKPGSMKSAAIEETESAVDVALRQKVAQYELEMDKVRRTLLKGSVARTMQRCVGDRVKVEEAVLATEGAPDYRARTRDKRARMRTDLNNLLNGSGLDDNLRAEIQKSIDRLHELDELDVSGPAQSRAKELQPGGLTPTSSAATLAAAAAAAEEERKEEAERVLSLHAGTEESTAQMDRAALLEQQFNRLDPDGNGFIEPLDLLTAIRDEEERYGVELEERMSMRDVTLVVNRLDGVGGQKDGVLELREFVGGMKDVRKISQATVMLRFFELWDEVQIELEASHIAENVRRAQSFRMHHDPTSHTRAKSTELEKSEAWQRSSSRVAATKFAEGTENRLVNGAQKAGRTRSNTMM